MNSKEKKYLKNLYIFGYDNEGIVLFLNEKFDKKYTINDIEPEIETVTKELKEYEINGDIEKKIYFKRLGVLFQNAYNIQDYKLCLQINKEVISYLSSMKSKESGFE